MFETLAVFKILSEKMKSVHLWCE